MIAKSGPGRLQSILCDLEAVFHFTPLSQNIAQLSCVSIYVLPEHYVSKQKDSGDASVLRSALVRSFDDGLAKWVTAETYTYIMPLFHCQIVDSLHLLGEHQPVMNCLVE